ncbi:MAG: trypsin-like peptidase domain-containing protein [Candidatus Omnitrophica bacterium]|nr:trypsin-like peptidase domain-containing protein [Candidatus Omnitrophota bacterium]
MFKNGTRLKGTIVKRAPTEVTVQFDFGTTGFAPGDIIAVEAEPERDVEVVNTDPAPTPPSAFPASQPTSARSTDTPPQPDDATPGERLIPEGEPIQNAAQAALPNAMKAVAYIGVAKEDGSIGLGSGTIISSKGVMVTNYHVVADAVEIRAIFPASEALGRPTASRSFEARLLKTDPCYDLAVISIPAKTPNYLRFAEDHDVRAGEEVRAIGNPEGLTVSVSKGIISAVSTLRDLVGPGGLDGATILGCEQLSDRVLENATVIQTDATVNPGNSGGPLLNAQNDVVGIVTARYLGNEGDSTGLNFAIHVKHIRKFAGAYAEK